MKSVRSKSWKNFINIAIETEECQCEGFVGIKIAPRNMLSCKLLQLLKAATIEQEVHDYDVIDLRVNRTRIGNFFDDSSV